jgi:hypothetical protein
LTPHRTPLRLVPWRASLLLVIGLVVVGGCTGGGSVVVPPELPPTTLPATSATTTTIAPDESPTDTSAPEETGPIRIDPSDDASAIVDAAPENTEFEFLPGIHRGFSVEPKDGTSFIGRPGAILSGAVELSGPEVTATGWRFVGIDRTGDERGSCIDGYEGCMYSQDLFYDDVMLWQVTDIRDLESGTWFWGDDGIHVFDDPASRRVELSVEEHAFRSDASDVTITGLLVEKYATPAQLGAIQAQEPGNGDRGDGWLIEGVEVRGAHGAGIRTGDRTIVRNVYSHHNGQMGISVSGGTDVLLERNEFAYNNIAGFKWGWEAGGTKFTRTTGLIVRDNHSHHNDGPGLWTDIDNVDTLYEGNLVEHNTGPGIFHEISYSAVIRNNVVLDNGSRSTWLWDAGILIAASSEVEVYGNEVRRNSNAIAGIQQDRGGGDYGIHLLDDLDVYDNVIELAGGAIGVVEDVQGDNVFTDRIIRFDGNVYVGPTGQAYRWYGKRLGASGWVEYGFDRNGVWE